jgi:hypothetical protein
MDEKVRQELRFLKAYAVLSSLLLATLITMGVVDRKKEKFDAIDVQRINIVEPEGTLRMVISNKAAFPGLIVKGKEYPHADRQAAGMLFLNEEGTENGGLIFGGKKDEKGNGSSYGHPSFDAYEQDQVLTLDSGEEAGHKQVALSIVDRPDWPITDLLNLPQNQWEKFLAGKPQPRSRIYLGRSKDKSVAMRFRDADGHDRIVIKVAADGTPSVQFLDAVGKIISQVPESQK